MTDIATTDEVFFNRTGMDQSRVGATVTDALNNADDGELFLEYRQSESITFDDGRVRNAAFDTSQGFGLRAVAGEATGFSHASELSEAAIARAAATVKAVQSGHTGTVAGPPPGTNRSLYADLNPLGEMPFEDKVALLTAMDAYARAQDDRVSQVSATLGGSWQAVQIIRGDGTRVADIRPLVRLNVSIVARDGDRMESGSHGVGGRGSYAAWVDPSAWQAQVDIALQQALTNLRAQPAPAGDMPVVLGPGWPGVMLHEAVGHGLEGDANRKKTSVFAGMMGERVAAPGVTVVDDGTIQDRRGSLTVDDEGTPSDYTVLIEDGILKNYMQDRLNGRLMKQPATGNGRRQSYAHHPMPRMTNTYMLSGDAAPEDVIKAAKNGIYAVNFGGGQVDVTSGEFVFSCTEAYLIEDGKIGAPVKGATLIGNGPKAMEKVKMVGNDSALDTGVGTCGKDGQSVPVGVGQPTMLIESITVGGTAV